MRRVGSPICASRVWPTSWLIKPIPIIPRNCRKRCDRILRRLLKTRIWLCLQFQTHSGPAFARDYVQAPNADAPSAMASLGAARYNYAAIQMPGADLEAPGYQGQIVDGRILPKEKAAIQEGARFLSIPQKVKAPTSASPFPHQDNRVGWSSIRHGIPIGSRFRMEKPRNLRGRFGFFCRPDGWNPPSHIRVPRALVV